MAKNRSGEFDFRRYAFAQRECLNMSKLIENIHLVYLIGGCSVLNAVISDLLTLQTTSPVRTTNAGIRGVLKTLYTSMIRKSTFLKLKQVY